MTVLEFLALKMAVVFLTKIKDYKSKVGGLWNEMKFAYLSNMPLWNGDSNIKLIKLAWALDEGVSLSLSQILFQNYSMYHHIVMWERK